MLYESVNSVLARHWRRFMGQDFILAVTFPCVELIECECRIAVIAFTCRNSSHSRSQN